MKLKSLIPIVLISVLAVGASAQQRDKNNGAPQQKWRVRLLYKDNNEGIAVGDIDGDGSQEIVVGSPNDDDGGENAGAVFVLSLPTAGSVLELQEVLPVAAQGQGIAWDRSEPGTLYSILRSTREVVVSRLR